MVDLDDVSMRKQLLGEDDFASSMAIAQMLPGANVVNLVICIGEQLRGLLERDAEKCARFSGDI